MAGHQLLEHHETLVAEGGALVDVQHLLHLGEELGLLLLVGVVRDVLLEIQPPLVEAARDLGARIGAGRVAVVEGDAALTAGRMMIGSVFFLYCPFSGERLKTVLAGLESIAQTRPIRVCCLDLPLPECPWLVLSAQPSAGLDIYRSR